MNGKIEPVDVRIVRSPEELTELAVEFGAWSTWNVPQIGTITGTLAPILSRRVSRDEARIFIPPPQPIAGVLNQIPLGASGVATFNNNPIGVNLTIAGGTVSQIAINGTNTNLTSGTFFVPAGGTVTVTDTVPPTTFTTTLVPGTIIPATQPLTAVVLAHRQDYVSNAANPQGAIIPVSALPVQFVYKAQQPVYAVGVGAGAVVLTLDTAQAARQSMAEEAEEEIPEEYQEEGQALDPGYR